MGTNYYIKCLCCGSKIKHLGKKSYLNKFASNFGKQQVMNIIENLEHSNVIIDEYNNTYKRFDFLNKINILNCEWEIIDGEFS